MDESKIVEILNEVLDERGRQNEKWKEQDHNPIIWSAILGEECGEFSEAALHKLFGGPKAKNLRIEAIHSAAVAVQIIECLDRGTWNWGFPE